MTLWVLLNVYQEAENLPRSVSSILKVFGGNASFVFVDGRYPDYPEGPDFSDDGTKELAEGIGFYLPVSDYECEKRTAGLRFIDEQAVDGDYVLYLDADETLTEFNRFPDRVGYFSFTRDSNPEVEYGRCRLYRWEPGLEFRHRHYDLFDADGDLVASLEDAPSYDYCGSGIHYDRSHSLERRELKRAYYKRLRERETHPAEAAV